jgi:hypothetical protein
MLSCVADPGVFGRIRILALINDPISTFLVCVKAINTSGISVVNFWSMKILFIAYFHEKNFQQKIWQKFI